MAVIHLVYTVFLMLALEIAVAPQGQTLKYTDTITNDRSLIKHQDTMMLASVKLVSRTLLIAP